MLDYDEAVLIFQSIPDSVLCHEGIALLLKQSADFIAEALPSVDKMWTPGVTSPELREAWILNEKVRELPILALASALRSQKLKTESETTLLRFVCGGASRRWCVKTKILRISSSFSTTFYRACAFRA